METFEEYLSNLPKNLTTGEAIEHQEKNKPYIVGDTIEKRLDESCMTETPTRRITVFVPEVNDQVTFNFHHHGSKNPYEECRATFKQKLIDGGLPEDMAKTTTDLLYRQVEGLLGITNEQRLLNSAYLSRTTRNYELGERRINDLVRSME